MRSNSWLFGFILVAACGTARPAPASTPRDMAANETLPPKATPSSTVIVKPTDTLVVSTLTPEATYTPWIFPSGLSIEEHPLAKAPEIEPLVILPLEALTQTQLVEKHMNEWVKPLSPHEYYSIGGGDVWVMQGKDKLEAVWAPMGNGKVIAQVTRNGKIIFSIPINPPAVGSPLRVLSVYDNHWVFEVAKEKTSTAANTQPVDSFFSGEIFIDGQSLDQLHGYDESFGFQTIQGRPFYFYKRDGKTGISYDGQEIALGYDGVWHYGCCSGGELNPRMAQAMIGFFAWRGKQWYYTEIGVFGQPGRN
jgi:hypothetical protein